MPVSEPSVASYRLALDRLNHVSRSLAYHFESSDQRGAELIGTQQFGEILTQYKRTLAECQRAFRHLPASEKAKVPRPPRE
jgi:hypothetical protein